MKHLKAGDIVATEHDVIDVTNNTRFPSGTLFKVAEVDLIRTVDHVNEEIRLRPLSPIHSDEIVRVDISDVVTCENIIYTNTERAHQILKRKNYERNSKLCPRLFVAYLSCGLGGVAFYALSVLSPIVPIILLALCFLLLVALVGLDNQNDTVRESAAKCIFTMRALRINNNECHFVPLDLDACGVKMCTDEIEQQAICSALGINGATLSSLRLGEKGNEYAAYKAVAENTLDNLKVLQDFLQSQTKEIETS